jgi:hypothetical protein
VRWYFEPTTHSRAATPASLKGRTMATTSIIRSIARMRSGDHYCGLYRTDDDHRAIIVDYIRAGVYRNEKMLYIVNIQTAAELKATLSAAFVNVDELLQKRQLVILTAREAYLKDGQFEPDRMIDLLREETEKALAEGYAALRVTGEMTWALAGEPGSERLVEYESKLNEFYRNSKCSALCQYDRRRFDAELLLDILQMHPKVLFGRDAFDNSEMYYVSNEAFSSADRQSAVLDTWLTNLSKRSADLG